MHIDSDDTAQAHDAHEALMQFLYRAPIGLAQTTLAGEIEMINPMSARLLMPLSRDGGLDNLFEVLDGLRPSCVVWWRRSSRPAGWCASRCAWPSRPAPVAWPRPRCCR